MKRYTHKDRHTCPGCGKWAYPTRAAAKQAARGRYADLRPYRCARRPDWWHLGHLPPEVIRGTIPRDGVRHVLDDRERDLAAFFGAPPPAEHPRVSPLSPPNRAQ